MPFHAAHPDNPRWRICDTRKALLSRQHLPRCHFPVRPRIYTSRSRRLLELVLKEIPDWRVFHRAPPLVQDDSPDREKSRTAQELRQPVWV